MQHDTFRPPAVPGAAHQRGASDGEPVRCGLVTRPGVGEDWGGRVTIFCGDAVKWAREYTGPLHHGLLCDCPYHLASIVKRFGGKDAAPAQEGTDGAFRRMSRGFMGADWDGVDENGDGVAMKPETWAAFARVLYPGAFLLVFAGCLNDDAISMAMREAGLIKHHSLHWAFGSGFPKATRIKATDELQREVRRAAVCAVEEAGLTLPGNSKWDWTVGEHAPGNKWWAEFCKWLPSLKGSDRSEVESRIVATIRKKAGWFTAKDIYEVREDNEADAVWAGHRYGRQSIKPAVETILLFQVPYEGRPLDCITRTGAGALNIDLARIPGSAGIRKEDKPRHGGVFAGSQTRPYIEEALAAGVPARETYETAAGGRWPANFIVGDEAAAAMLDRQSGITKSGSIHGMHKGGGGDGIYSALGTVEKHFEGSEGGCSRFFFNVQTAIDEADPVIYCAKAGTSERSAGLDSFTRQANADWPQSLDGNDARGASPRANNHPTVKALSLTRHLASLLLPPPEYGPRRLFVPFAGVSSEMCGADLAGWEEVNGVEQSAEYCRIGEARRRFWSMNSGLFEQLTQENETEEIKPQGSLF